VPIKLKPYYEDAALLNRSQQLPVTVPSGDEFDSQLEALLAPE